MANRIKGIIRKDLGVKVVTDEDTGEVTKVKRPTEYVLNEIPEGMTSTVLKIRHIANGNSWRYVPFYEVTFKNTDFKQLVIADEVRHIDIYNEDEQKDKDIPAIMNGVPMQEG